MTDKKRGRPTLYMDIKEVAPRVGIADKTLYKWVQAEKFEEIPKPIRRGRKILWWRKEIDRLFPEYASAA